MDEAYSGISIIDKYFDSPIIAQLPDRFEMKKSQSPNLDEAPRDNWFSDIGTKRSTGSYRSSIVHIGQKFTPSNNARFNVPGSVPSSSTTADSSPSPVFTRSTDLIYSSPSAPGFDTLNLITTPVTVRTINLMIQKHPELEAELNLLKRSILGYEKDRHSLRSAIEAEKHDAFYEMELKAEKLEIGLKKQTDYVETVHERLSEFDDMLDEAENCKQAVKEMKKLLQAKEKEIQRLKRNKISNTLQSEREKSGLATVIEDLERRLKAELARADDQKQQRDDAIQSFEAMKNRMDTYLSYFERQGSQLRNYLFDEEKDQVGFKEIDGPMEHGFGFRRLDAGKVVKLPSIIEEDESKEGAIKIRKFFPSKIVCVQLRHRENVH